MYTDFYCMYASVSNIFTYKILLWLMRMQLLQLEILYNEMLPADWHHILCHQQYHWGKNSNKYLSDLFMVYVS